jgi:hypothetical protein
VSPLAEANICMGKSAPLRAQGLLGYHSKFQSIFMSVWPFYLGLVSPGLPNYGKLAARVCNQRPSVGQASDVCSSLPGKITVMRLTWKCRCRTSRSLANLKTRDTIKMAVSENPRLLKLLPTTLIWMRTALSTFKAHRIITKGHWWVISIWGAASRAQYQCITGTHSCKGDASYRRQIAGIAEQQ